MKTRPKHVERAVRSANRALIIKFARAGGRETAKRTRAESRKQILEEILAQLRCEEARGMADTRRDHLIPEDDR